MLKSAIKTLLVFVVVYNIMATVFNFTLADDCDGHYCGSDPKVLAAIEKRNVVAECWRTAPSAMQDYCTKQ